MAEHSMAGDDAAAVQEHVVPEAMVAAHRALWADFGKLLLGNIIAIAVVLILMAIFLT
jgi:hypothetical protein